MQFIINCGLVDSKQLVRFVWCDGKVAKSRFTIFVLFTAGVNRSLNFWLDEMQKMIWFWNTSDSSCIDLTEIYNGTERHEFPCVKQYILNVSGDRRSQQNELQRLYSKHQPGRTAVQEAFQSLLNDIIKPCFQNLIEKIFFEKIHWTAAIKKISDINDSF